MSKTEKTGKEAVGNGHHKDYVHNYDTEHGRKIAEEAQERADAKEAFKADYQTHAMQISRDDIDRLHSIIAKQPNVGRFKRLVEFMMGDKGFWTETLTLNIVDNDTEYDDYHNPHESISEQVEALEEKIKQLKARR